ncbi:hypothetical protein EZL74_02705 [Flavobacterium silvisoli]|uniref:Uncharacterized protein n=1 Tax=Flavobacterium silvisoli TaxID=2529433 RepID=A0A4Q9Z5A9_9FLAO|nr:hypothetical protein [Flavobacterium silvisoli]TBX70604.1 hypothetical protein EZL74_02705 [Flavobacterium silvisoli]
MNTKETDILNIILIIVSLALAFNLPFELFLFSYAFLGPLHYLTEINWLKEKNYFLRETKWIWFFVTMAFLLCVPLFLKLLSSTSLGSIAGYQNFLDFMNKIGDEIIVVSLMLALGLIYFKKKKQLILFLLLSLSVVITLLNYLPAMALTMVVFVPTIVHVYFFTLLFMIYGTIHSKSTPGIIAIVLLILVPLIIMTSHINTADYFPLKEKTVTSFNGSNFGILTFNLSHLFEATPEGAFNFMSVLAIKTQIFIAFAYTYHYLNWFSKTSVIGWNKNLSKTKTYTILAIWAVSIALYLYEYRIGFIALLFLSLIHVFLEFPLNMTSIKGIVAKVKVK